MKINLNCEQNILNGYVNVSNNPETTADVHVEKYDDLSRIVKTESAVDEIYINDLLQLYNPDDVSKVMQYWRSLIKDGGVLKIKFFTITHMARLFYQRRLSIGEFHSFVFGSAYENKALVDIDLVKKLLPPLKLRPEIISVNSAGLAYIEAIKE
jgi:hypothetical protein